MYYDRQYIQLEKMIWENKRTSKQKADDIQ